MVADCFTHVETWVFDLDNTLYPPHMRLFDQIEARMTAYVMRVLNVPSEEADRLRATYWAEFGTTLAGLMDVHDLDPGPYLTDVHDIDFSVLDPDPHLAQQVRGLTGRKIVYTNGSAPYAEQVLHHRGLSGIFDAVYGVEHAGFRPKPERGAFETVFAKDGVQPRRGAMFEDDVRNLKVPHALGMQTVHVAPDPVSAEHIHHHTSDLGRFLQQLNR